jgi:AhpD family alkylhydroperoxidase
MEARLNPYAAAPLLMKALETLEAAVRESGLPQALTDLVKTRASQINACAFCIHLHTKEARRRGETEARLYLLSAWHESPMYSEDERAALTWTEAVTLVANTHVPDDVYEFARSRFDEEDLVKLTVLIGVINVWNRIAVSFRSVHPWNQHQPDQGDPT